MAHIAKYKATSVGHMLAHYRRDASSLERDNIDPKRTKDNMVVAHYTNKDGQLVVGRVVPREGEPNWGTVERRIERVNEAQKAAGKRATRKDAVVMADVVVTLPDNVRKGDEDRFFRLTYWYLSKKFGIDNMMGGHVHKDEVLKDGTPARDHMHVPFTPILDGRFNYKKMCPRSFYQSMHKELGDYLERSLGYRPEVELGEETRAQRVYTDKSVDIDKVRGAVDRAVVRPAEDEAARIVAAAKEEAAALLSDAEAKKAELAQQIEDRQGDLAKLDSQLEDVRMDIAGEEDRLECLRQRADRVARDVAELRPIAADVRGWEAAGKAERGAILDRICAKCDGLASRIRADVAGIRLKVEELRSRISRPLEYLMPKPKVEQRGPNDVMREATEVARASKALSRNHVAPTNSRPRGQAR
jgi:DNA repair exonuclease SbcCD ATPase subunit